MSAKKNSRSGDPDSDKADKKIHAVEFRMLEMFLAVSTSGGFRKGAERGNYHQPLLTKCMDQLEEFLEIELFERDQRRPVDPKDPKRRRLGRLTPTGQKFRVHAEQLIRMREDLVGMFRDRSTVHGIVRLGVSESIVHTWLPELLKQLTAAYPNLDLEIDVDISPKLRDLLVAGELDLAFLLGPINAPNLRGLQLCKFPVKFIASEKFAGAITLQEIVNRNHRIITFARETQPHMALRNRLDQLTGRATIWASASLEAVVRLAREGLGIAVIPPDILKNKVGVSGLRPLNTDIDLPPLDYWVSWSGASRTTNDNTVQAVIDIAMKVAREWPKAARLRRSGRKRLR
jgi:DNA-binding transcriptional LysR family regulator